MNKSVCIKVRLLVRINKLLIWRRRHKLVKIILKDWEINVKNWGNRLKRKRLLMYKNKKNKRKSVQWKIHQLNSWIEYNRSYKMHKRRKMVLSRHLSWKGLNYNLYKSKVSILKLNNSTWLNKSMLMRGLKV